MALTDVDHVVVEEEPTLHEVWADAAVYVPPDDHDGLAAAVNALIAAPRYRAEMATRAGERAARYTPAQMAEEYMAAYRELLEPPPVQRRQVSEPAISRSTASCGS